MDLCNINDIKFILSKYGFHFSKSMGQNFLIENWVPRRFVEDADVNKNCGVLEIGPGIGCLTQRLSENAGKVVSIELDKKLLPVLDETLSGCNNVEIINGDALKVDIPKLVEEKFSGLRPVVCANLPYNITSPILTMLIETGCFEQITVMIQKEVAKRICSNPGKSDYGALTLFINYYMKPKMLFDVAPGCFIPQPKVTSTVITMHRRKAPPAKTDNAKLLFRIIRAAFSQRRKVMHNSLSAYLGNKLTKEEIADIIYKCGFKPTVRGEELSIEDFIKLANLINTYI